MILLNDILLIHELSIKNSNSGSDVRNLGGLEFKIVRLLKSYSN